MYFALNPSKNVDDDVSASSLVAAITLGTATMIDAGNNDGAEGARSRVTDVSAAAKLFTFPGYIVFTLMGPIVEDFNMLCHRSDLLMTSTPIFSSTAEKKLAGRTRARQQLQESKRKRQHCNNDEDDGVDNSSNLTSSTAACSLATLSERLQAAGIAQSRLAHLGKKKAKLNDRIVSMHLKRVTGKQSIIAEQKFLISATAVDDPNRQLYLVELRKLNQELAHAIQDLTFAEEQIIDDEVAETSDVNQVDVMIDSTIASVLLNNHDKQPSLRETTVSPMPTFHEPDDNEGEDNVDSTT